VSPFGARGGNGGIQDVDNLVWKLAAVLKGEAPARLLDSYDEERIHGADENILNSTRATNFMTPKSPYEFMLREEVLTLAEDTPFARRLVNSGRLSVPCSLADMALQSDDDAQMQGPMAPGAPCLDAPIRDAADKPAWLLDHLGGEFMVLSFGAPAATALPQVVVGSKPTANVQTVADKDGLVTQRYGGADGVAYLIRPDQHVAARFAKPTKEKIAQALLRARGGGSA